MNDSMWTTVGSVAKPKKKVNDINNLSTYLIDHYNTSVRITT